MHWLRKKQPENNRINTGKQPSEASCAEQSKSNNHIRRNTELTKMQCETNLSRGGVSLTHKDASWQRLSQGRQSHHQCLEQHATENCHSQNSWLGGWGTQTHGSHNQAFAWNKLLILEKCSGVFSTLWKKSWKVKLYGRRSLPTLF